MKTLYIECNMGAAGDMLFAALLELSEHPDKILEKVNALGLDNVSVSSCESVKCGIKGTHVSVRIREEEEASIDVSQSESIHSDSALKIDFKAPGIRHFRHVRMKGFFPVEDTDSGNGEHTHESHSSDHHSHNGYHEILHKIENMPLSERVKKDACAIYALIAQAEGQVHGRPVSEVHFHEVGSLDAIVDIVGTCLLMEDIDAQKVVVSPIHVGSGFVRCAHGTLPVPAPATALILREIPIVSGRIKGELCTPTGAAILKYFADSFGTMPEMRVDKIGYGMGTKDFEAANCVRIFSGFSTDFSDNADRQIAELACNLDDMTGEEIAFACTQLLKEGALDVFTQAIQMKKNRPAVLLTCLCKKEDAHHFARLMLLHTSTFGIRKTICDRYILDRESIEKNSSYGTVRWKKGVGYGVKKEKAEYEDLAALAESHNTTVKEIRHSFTEMSID